MARFLLIHGASHGAWCWRDVVPALEALGHKATAIDLPSHGADPTPVNDVTLDLYAQAICRHLTVPAVLVGHSMGGYAITRAAEMAPDNIQRLVYLCAHTPWPGKTMAEMRFLGATQPLAPALRAAADGLSHSFDLGMAPDLFYQDCPQEAVDYALPRLCPQALAPAKTVVELTANSQDKPRSYILCRKDGAIPPDLQEKLTTRFAPEDVHELDSGHSPFFSMPDRLADLLHRIATQTP
ncbi:alpha/beta fold hydrolase [Mameliella sediminis]|uniref:alpha/beta fold hydrolase n=1 Tax=Mameliella sediminis TaxID=2836866 RepID=UPI001C45C06E|nr:alpha/beta fold hydrolase [Mameliella sediminis]MBV7395784.1 alpha/beta fold hydrolase [Mameliella sediminis]